MTSMRRQAPANLPLHEVKEIQCTEMNKNLKTIQKNIDNNDVVETIPTKSDKSFTFSQKLTAEGIGTFFIVHFGCSTVCTATYNSAQVGIWQIASVWGIAVALAIYTSVGISGGHLNPAISIAMKICRSIEHKHFGWMNVAAYCIAQTLGAVAGAALNYGLYFESIEKFENENGIVRGSPSSVASAVAFGEYWTVSSWQHAFFAEAAGTFMLSFLIFSLTNPRNDAVPKNFAPALIGGAVACLLSIIAPLTQGGFNPARDFGPRIVTLAAGWKGVAMQGWYVYVFGPIVGAILGGFLSEKLLWRA